MMDLIWGSIGACWGASYKFSFLPQRVLQGHNFQFSHQGYDDLMGVLQDNADMALHFLVEKYQ